MKADIQGIWFNNVLDMHNKKDIPAIAEVKRGNLSRADNVFVCVETDVSDAGHPCSLVMDVVIDGKFKMRSATDIRLNGGLGRIETILCRYPQYAVYRNPGNHKIQVKTYIRRWVNFSFFNVVLPGAELMDDRTFTVTITP